MGPLAAAEFSQLMAPLGPFEPCPRIAVAVSGGADSLVLLLLAAEWARGLGGEAVGLTVDHGLRPEAAAEAARVGEWLAARGLAHHVSRWTGPHPSADIQAAAREARYRLLAQWCAANGVLHLVLAHHRDDQAETLLLRLGRGSGVDGLAAMAAVEAGREVRLLRPLLGVPAPRLRATLVAAGQEWIEDSSNRNGAFARVRLRHLAPALAAEGLTAPRLAATAARMGRARAALEDATAEAALRHTTLHPAGFAWVAAGAFAALPEEIGLRLLAHLVRVIGGGAHVPRLERLERLHAELRSGPVGGRTLAGCRLAAERDGRLVVCREPARIAPPLALPPGEIVGWDGRFRLAVAADAPAGMTVGALGIQGWRMVARLSGRRPPPIPAIARPTLPAITDADGLCVVPHLGYNRDGIVEGALDWIVPVAANPLTAAGRCLA